MTQVGAVVLFPGSGSSSTHSSLTAIEAGLAPIPVVRCDFPYRLAGRSFPDKPPVLMQCVRDNVRATAESLGVPVSRIVIGGRSMGGRICSMVVADDEDPLAVAGLVLISYPLHPPGKPENLRTAHLGRITVPMLCVSGTKDSFGTPDELRTAFEAVPAKVEWSWVEGARHELARKDDDVASRVSAWVAGLGKVRRAPGPR